MQITNHSPHLVIVCVFLGV